MQNHDADWSPNFIQSSAVSRRALLAGAAGLAASMGLGQSARGAEAASQPAAAGDQPSADSEKKMVVSNGRLNQSVVWWCFQKSLSIEALAAAAARMGLKSLELAGPEHWPVIKKHGLICAISPSHPFTKGFAHKEEHEECLAVLRKSIDATSDAGYPSVITFSGMRRGLSDGEGVANMVAGLKQIAGYAEQKKVTVCLEMLNSRVNVEMKGHPDYFCDQIERSIEVIRGVGSPRVKLLYDIYHVQIMEGDVISRIRQFNEYIGHYHTAGVPGRNELDNSQEINYPPIMEAIVATGYKGYVGQEFIPAHAAPLVGLAEAVRRCDV